MLHLAQDVWPGNLTNLGAAGVMGAMWLWERSAALRRERQLEEAHARVMAEGVKVEALLDVVRRNGEAMAELASSQRALAARLGEPHRPHPPAARVIAAGG